MSIMQSIKPQYCELIAAGRKTYEVRKTRPKIETPFKVYIYCTKDGFYGLQSKTNPALETNASGKVIGEYICDEIQEIKYSPAISGYAMFYDDLKAICLTYDELLKYCKGKPLYLWHISNLKIYEEPKALSEFRKPCKMLNSGYCDLRFDEGTCGYQDVNEFCGVIRCDNRLTRPPQSWCFCEEV